MGIQSYHHCVAVEFLLVRHQDISGAERLLGDSKRAPGRESMGGLPH